MPGAEIQTAELVRHALSNGKEVFVPWLYATAERDRGRDGYLPKRAMDMVRLRDVADFEGLGRDAWGIPTVGDGQGRERLVGGEAGGNGEGHEDGNGKGKEKGEAVKGLDMMLLPGVAFQKLEGDKRVRRLGHGKGFYDFFLRRYAERYGEGIRLFGLALKEQVLEGQEGEVPVGEHDCLLHGIVVGNGNVVE
jgi:5-formyltetrahydrofolate cyclo-ligase